MRRFEAEAVAMVAEFDGVGLLRMTERAGNLRQEGHGSSITYSRKVFIPLTKLCRDTCRYCTFAISPRPGVSAYLSVDEALAISRQGREQGCREALLTLGDTPEARWPQARAQLDEMGFSSTLDYLAHIADAIRRETGLLPHLNPGLMGDADFVKLRPLAASMGIMLEGIAPALIAKGGAHHGCPDKEPARRLATIEAAGRHAVPFTSGLLIGIGETRSERVEALLELRALHQRYGHIQEVIVQPFRAKPGTRMADAPEPSDDELLWTIAAARILFGAGANIQSPPNLASSALEAMVAAGINDLGGISPVTCDHVNPEAPWPEIEALSDRLEAAGYCLSERLTIYPSYVRNIERWVDRQMAGPILASVDGEGMPMGDGWLSGETPDIPAWAVTTAPALLRADPVRSALREVEAGRALDEGKIAGLFSARGADFHDVCDVADGMRRSLVGDEISYVVTRNINYTNMCTYGCGFCAFSKGRVADDLRERPFRVSLDEITRRVAEAWERGATEVCMQGGIHPAYTGRTYLDIVAAAKRGAPDMHIHAFSPLEIQTGARALNLNIADYLAELKSAGLGSLPGTAAEILDDDVRDILCPDKIRTDEWLNVVRTAHGLGIPTTSTIMFGHVDGYRHWARHLLRLRDLQQQTGGLTEFVPLPFVAREAPIFRRGRSRKGPSFREAVLMHAVSRLTFGALLPNIQTSWVKMGPAGGQFCLNAGANDFGGTLMNETITRSAGASHGQEMSAARFEALIHEIGRTPRQRTTLYANAGPDRYVAALRASALEPVKYEPAVARSRLAVAGQAD
jgi:FO synthase